MGAPIPQLRLDTEIGFGNLCRAASTLPTSSLTGCLK